ncbi:hypothetical protein [Novosphingobium lindaniclasticum]|uniref:hypothetical protein n=1 Tax=Novosphingobium lindaniclasticum TaxID=1329895 RepID=UPI0009DBD9E7|nr:hypothetical protein [Novosphingobium lindaniclasticum]
MAAEVVNPLRRNEIARLALAMDEHSYFFSLRRGVKTRFSRDLNGSGTQGIYINRADDEFSSDYLISVVFQPSYGKDDEFLYEADLITDQRKDYEPTVNRGKHRFKAWRAYMEVDWNGDECRQWQADVVRLSRSADTLTGWIQADLEMIVRCGSRNCWHSAILSKTDLERHVAAGMTLEALTSQFKCSECNKREARISAF